MIELPPPPASTRYVMGQPVSDGTGDAFTPIANPCQPSLEPELARALSTIAPFPKRFRLGLCPKQAPGYLVNADKQKVFPAGCMSWSCRKCAAILAHRVRKRLKPIPWTAKIELTLAGDGSPTRENNLRLALGTRYLLQFVRRYFRRKYGPRFKLRYARMHGVGERFGRLHSHLIWDAPYIPQEVLSEHAEACGLGFRVFIRAVDARDGRRDRAVDYVADQAVRYVSEQAVTSGEHRDLPRGARRFQSSGVPPYTAEEGWHWQELYPDFNGQDIAQPYDAELSAFGPVLREHGSNGSERIVVGIERVQLGFLDLSSLVLNGESASPAPAGAEKPIQLRWGLADGFG